MDPIATISGLATGIDFRGLVDQIIAAESQPLRQIEQQMAQVTKRSAAWEDFRLRITDLKAAASKLAKGTSFHKFSTSVASGTGPAPFTVSAKKGAEVGSFDLEVLNTATREKLGGSSFTTRDQALGFSGEFLVGGKVVSVAATDSLSDIASQVNAANGGLEPSGVSASIVQTSADDFRLVLSASEEGAAGVNLVDGADGVLRDLGVFGTGTTLKSATSDGAMSDRFLSQTDPLGDVLAFGTTPAAGTVTLGTLDVNLDLSTQSLNDVVTAINDAAGVAGSGVSAKVVIETDSDGTAYRRLDISGTTSFTDSGGMLESLGILTGSREAVAQQVESHAFTDGDDTTLATATTQLSDMFVSGSDANVQVGDTLTLTGTRGDGTEFTKTFTVASGDDLQDVLDSLNSDTDGYQVGSATATASIVDGKLVVTDDTGGDSRLSLSIVSHNEGGGSLDFGEFATAEAGRDREIVGGQDAQMLLDGNYVTRSSNSVSDVVAGVTVNLLSATDGPVSASVTRDTEAIKTELQSFVDAYNDITEFVTSQSSGVGAAEGAENAPLSGDITVRQMRDDLRSAMNTLIDPSVGDYRGLFAIGIEIDQEGMFSLNDATLDAALASDPTSVERLFAEYGTGSVGTLGFVSGTEDLRSGSYAVEITTAPTKAIVTSSGFGGTYVDDATADTLTVTDTGSSYEYSVEVSNGMTMDDIVATLNAEFGTKLNHTIQNDAALYSDAVGTAATAATTLDNLFDAGGTNMGVANGDVITISGMTPGGVSTFSEFVVTDVATQTVGELQEAINDAMSGQVEVILGEGLFQLKTLVPGQSFLSFSVSSNNTGGGTFAVGTFAETQQGRGIANITASNVGGELRIAHDHYGSGNGIEVAFTAGGGDGTGSLGLAAGTTSGIDVAGTIDGLTATGTGSVLKSTAETAIKDLQISYVGTDTGAIGDVTFSRGVGAAMEEAAELLLGSGFGSIDDVVDTLDQQIESMKSRSLNTEARLERRREALILKFSKLEEAMSVAQAQGNFLSNQLAGLQGLLGNS